MSVRDNKAVIRRWMDDLWNGRNLDAADEIFAPHYVRRGSEVTGPAGVKEMAKSYLAAFPDLEFRMNEMIGEADLIAIRYTARGTMAGPLMGLPPTKKLARIHGMDFFRLEGGQIVESWPAWDELGMIQQLGLMPQVTLFGAVAPIADRAKRFAKLFSRNG